MTTRDLLWKREREWKYYFSLECQPDYKQTHAHKTSLTDAVRQTGLWKACFTRVAFYYYNYTEIRIFFPRTSSHLFPWQVESGPRDMLCPWVSTHKYLRLEPTVQTRANSVMDKLLSHYSIVLLTCSLYSPAPLSPCPWAITQALRLGSETRKRGCWRHRSIPQPPADTASWQPLCPRWACRLGIWGQSHLWWEKIIAKEMTYKETAQALPEQRTVDHLYRNGNSYGPQQVRIREDISDPSR